MENTTQSENLTRDGITALREGNKRQAMQLLYQATKADPKNQIAWLWLADIVTTDQDRRRCFERIIAIDANNRYGQQAAAALAQISHAPTKPPENQDEPESSPPDPTPPSTSMETSVPPHQVSTTYSVVPSVETRAPSRLHTTLLGAMTVLLFILVVSNITLVIIIGTNHYTQQARAQARQERLDQIAAATARQNQLVSEIMDSYERSAYNNPSVDRIAEQQLIATEHTLMALQIIATQNRMMIEILTSGP